MGIPLLPPRSETLIDDDKFATLNWLSFFENVAVGDAGTIWTPTFVGLTEVGTATKTGIYWRLSNRIAYFRIVITPTTNTSATAGTTYCDNFPLNIAQAGVSFSLSGSSAAIAGVTNTPKRIYTGNWTTITTPVTLVGIVEVS